MNRPCRAGACSRRKDPQWKTAVPRHRPTTQKALREQSFLYIEIYLNFGELLCNSRRAARVVRTAQYAAQIISWSFKNTVWYREYANIKCCTKFAPKSHHIKCPFSSINSNLSNGQLYPQTPHRPQTDPGGCNQKIYQQQK